MSELRIEYHDPNELKPYENNARDHKDVDIEAIRESIREFGFNDPIGIWSDENLIVEGHGRQMAAIAEGLDSVPCIRLDHLTDEQRRAYALAHNKTAELSEWIFGKLNEELAGIQEIDMSAFGFEPIPEPEPQVVEDEIPEEAETRCKPGDLWKLGDHRLICGDSTDVNVIDRLMDGVKADMVFTDSPYGMKKESEGVLNDNLNFDDLLDFNRQWIPLTFGALKGNGSWYCWGIDEPLMDIYSNILKPMAKENKITFRNLITWDKGHGQGQLSEDFRMYPVADEKCLFVMCGTMTTTSDECKGFEDGLSTWYEGFERFRAYFDEQVKKMGLTRSDIKKITNTYADHYFSKSQYAFPTKEHYSVIQSYCKKNGIEAFQWDYEEMRAEYLEQRNGKEYTAVLAKQAEKRKEWYETRAYFDNTHDNQNNVWHFDRAGKDERKHTGGHATPKPIALCSRAIKSSSREGEIVLDVFGGSGSTLIACEQLNRKCYMCELDPHYCDVIIERWEAFTGRKAEQIGGN